MEEKEITITVGKQKRTLIVKFSDERQKFNVYDKEGKQMLMNGILGDNEFSNSSMEIRLLHQEILAEVKRIMGVA